MPLPNSQQALSFLVQQAAYVEAQVYAVEYPEVQYPALIPIDESAPEWTKSVTFFSVDKVGVADWFHQAATDVPLADIERGRYEQGIEMAAVGYRYNLEEIAQSMQMRVNLQTDRAAAALRAYEEFVDRIALYGDPAKGWTGLINATNVDRTTVNADGTGNSPLWALKTDDQLTRDINDALTAPYITSLQTEIADTILLPTLGFTYLATRRIANTAMSMLEWIMRFNAYTALTGKPLTIRTVRGLETAGQGGVSRAIIYRKDPNVLRMHLPMRHRFLPVWQRGPLVFDVPGIFRLGGTEIRRPIAVRYIDGFIGVP